MKPIIPNIKNDLNILPLNNKVLLHFINKKIYIHPNPENTYFSSKYNMQLGQFSVIYNTTKYLPQYKKIVTLPLNIRFFLLYYYVNSILGDKTKTKIMDSLLSTITTIDSNNCKDNTGDIIMFPSDLIKN